MGNYGSIFKGYVDEVSKAITEATEAEQAARVKLDSITGTDLQARAARETAQQAYSDARQRRARTMNDLKLKYQGQLKDLKQKFVDDLDRERAADPSQLDMQAMKLMESGVLPIKDYQAIIEKYSDNATMQRLAAKYMRETASKTVDRDERAKLEQLANRASFVDNSKMQQFEALSDVFGRCINNPDLLPRFDDLTQGLCEEI